MDHIATARQAILELGSEDYWHLCDAAVYLPSVPVEQRQAVAREALLQLVTEGLVEIAYGHFATNAVKTVPREEVAAVLNNPDAWRSLDLGDQSYVFVNTDRGDEAYRGRAKP
jgi:hypothetical protein